MSQPPIDLAQIVRTYVDHYRRTAPLTTYLERVLRAICLCRTAALGGHLLACDNCGVAREHYNSCRNRHCPKCQFLDRMQWLENRQQELLPVTYFHVVFTLPDDLNPVVIRNPKPLYNLLFRTAAATLLDIAADERHLGARIGFLAVLHTWGQKLQLHPHIHCIVPGGGLALPGGERWVAARDNYFLPVPVLRKLFRGRFLDQLRHAIDHDELELPASLDPKHQPVAYRRWRDRLYTTDWVVYSKPPFGGSEKALGYLARYTHRTAFSSQRLVRVEDDRVYFHYKDYADGSRDKVTHLDALEFLRRFLLHVLPRGFHRIRYFGLFANRCRADNLERCRRLLVVVATGDQPLPGDHPARAAQRDAETWVEKLLRMTGVDATRCPVCKAGHMVVVEVLSPEPVELLWEVSRAPP